MGDIAEYYMDMAMEQDAKEESERYYEREYVDNIEKKYMLGNLCWETKYDGYILVSKMTKEHLKNTINFLHKKKQTETRKMWIKLLSIEANKRK